MEKPQLPSLDVLRSCFDDLLSPEPVMLAYLFGSAATGRMTPLSDVDIALVIDSETIPPANRLKFELRIEDLIVEKCELDRAEVRVINDAPLVIQGQVVTEGILLFARDENERIDFETKTRSRYFDFQVFARPLREAFFKRIRERGLYG